MIASLAGVVFPAETQEGGTIIDNPDIPFRIGPHEGHEFSLMREGKKNVALFFELEPNGLDLILAEGFNLLMFRQFSHLGTTFFTRIVFRNGHEAAAIRLKEIVQEDCKRVDPEREHEIGQILSYTREHVDAYIDYARARKMA